MNVEAWHSLAWHDVTLHCFSNRACWRVSELVLGPAKVVIFCLWLRLLEVFSTAEKSLELIIYMNFRDVLIYAVAAITG